MKGKMDAVFTNSQGGYWLSLWQLFKCAIFPSTFMLIVSVIQKIYDTFVPF